MLISEEAWREISANAYFKLIGVMFAKRGQDLSSAGTGRVSSNILRGSSNGNTGRKRGQAITPCSKSRSHHPCVRRNSVQFDAEDRAPSLRGG